MEGSSGGGRWRPAEESALLLVSLYSSCLYPGGSALRARVVLWGWVGPSQAQGSGGGGELFNQRSPSAGGRAETRQAPSDAHLWDVVLFWRGDLSPDLNLYLWPSLRLSPCHLPYFGGIVQVLLGVAPVSEGGGGARRYGGDGQGTPTETERRDPLTEGPVSGSGPTKLVNHGARETFYF